MDEEKKKKAPEESREGISVIILIKNIYSKPELEKINKK